MAEAAQEGKIQRTIQEEAGCKALLNWKTKHIFFIRTLYILGYMSKCDNLLIGFSTMAYRKNDARKDRAVRGSMPCRRA